MANFKGFIYEIDGFLNQIFKIDGFLGTQEPMLTRSLHFCSEHIIAHE